MNLTKKQEELLNKHLEMVLISNKVHNLTRITDPLKAKILHIEDSLQAMNEINELNNINLCADMGSGGGFPGIPLSIVSQKDFTLIETVGKKADCLKSFISELNIETSISVSNERVEEHAKNNRLKYDLVTARALSSLSSLLELASPLIKINGHFLSYKGENIDEELDIANHVENKFGFQLISNRLYTLSDRETKHRILLYKKVNESKIKLPRKLGFAQKKPFSK